MKRHLAIGFLLFLPVLLVSQSSYIIRPTIQEGLRGFQVQSTVPKDRPKVGLVLSGGGARALAQIGVLRALENNHIPIDLIVGNSLGSVVGGLYASGYTVAQIESIATHVNWDDLLSFNEVSNRTDLLAGQKQTTEYGYLAIRFDGLEPIIPSSVSGGQRVTNFFLNLTLQALYHPNPGFDQLKIPFRSVATDIRKGKRVVLDRGSLAEAMRASITVPFLYTPLEKDSMSLVDGGLLSNIPVDVAKSLNCDVVIVVNSTSELRPESEVNAPWEIADQIMTIMMQSANQDQLKMANVVITPEIGNHSLARFEHIDSLIQAGESAADSSIATIRRAILAKTHRGPRLSRPDSLLGPTRVSFAGDSVDTDIRDEFVKEASDISFSVARAEDQLTRLAALERYREVFGRVSESSNSSEIVYHLKENARVSTITLQGCLAIPADSLRPIVSPLEGKILNYTTLQDALEEILHTYRTQKYSLARIDSVQIDTGSGAITVAINEGTLGGLRFEGNSRTRDYVIRREFPLDKGDVFNLDQVYTGVTNIASTGLFDYVLVDVRYEGTVPFVVLRVKEKPDELLYVGLHADNERGIVSMVSLQDADFRGAGENLGVSFKYGLRDRIISGGYRANRIFQTYLTFDLKGYYRWKDVNTYGDDPTTTGLHWNRIQIGHYEDERYGGAFTFGQQFERFGDLTAELRAEHHIIDSISGKGFNADSYTLVAAKLQSTIDTENKFAFPTSGIYFNLSYDYSSKEIGSQESYSKVSAVYGSYFTFLTRNTIHPKITFGFADQTLPLSEQFSLGGYQSFLGLNEDDSRGRQIFLVNMEYRYWMPFKIIFDTYGTIRYDLGTISAVPEDLKLSTFHHGVGIELGLDTPLGPASFGAGASFLFERSISSNPISTGPLLFYFSIGPSI